MNVLDNIALPDVIVPKQNNDAVAAADDSPVFLLVASRDLAEDEMSLLQLYGKVLTYDNCHINIPLSDLIQQNNANYVIFDVRNKQHRMAISKASINHESNYHIIAVVNSWEKFDDFVDDINSENCLSSFPPKQAFKRDFDTLLLEKKIRKPSCLKNGLRIVLKALGGWSKDS